MRKDKVYWTYLTQSLLESFRYLDEAEREFRSYNLHYQIANKKAHSGHSLDEVHQHLMERIDPAYHASAYMQWYEYGGEAPVGAYIRNIAKHNFNMGDVVQHPKIDGVDVHKNLIHPDAITYMNRIHTVAKEIHKQKLPETISIYRGVGLVIPVSKENPYIPNAIESWTTDINTARKFAHMSHVPDAIPHVFRATVHRDDILLSHHMGDRMPFIPPESELEGKEEIIPLGHKIKNIERIE